MSANADKKDSAYDRQLAELETSLRRHENDESMLGEVGLAIRNLLAGNGESEAHIRQLLEREHDEGRLRPETYELVERLLAKIVAEQPAQAAEVAPAHRAVDTVDFDPTVTDAVEAPAPVQEHPQAREPAPAQQNETPYVDTEVLEEPQEPVAPAPVQNQLQVGSVLRDRFLLKEVVSEGTMGAVYKAMDRRMAEAGEENPFVAIKVLNTRLSRNADALRALQQEAAKGRYLSHSNIVRFIDLDREGDEYYLVMEWLEGRSLAKILDSDKGNSLDFATTMDIIRQVGRALTYAHQLGVVHADVKPGNIIVSPDGTVKLIDFGVARVRQKENEGKSRFDPNVMRAGSPAYSSMQVLTGEDPVPADDVFSLACLMYRLIAGHRVFGPRNAADAAQEGMEPQRPNGLSDGQWNALKKALAYSRVTRFETPQAFLEALSSGKGAPQPAPVPQAVPEAPIVPDQEVITTGELNIAHDDTTHVALDSPMRAERDPIMFEGEDEPRRSPWRLAVIGTILVASVFVVVQTGVIEDIDGLEETIVDIGAYVEDLLPATESPSIATPDDAPADEFETLEALPETDVAATTADDAEDNVVEELVIDTGDGTVAEAPEQVAVESPDEAAVAEAIDTPIDAPADEMMVDAAPEPSLPPPIDFSALPEPDLLLELKGAEDVVTPVMRVAMLEGDGDIVIDLVRVGDLSVELPLTVTEAAPSGQSAAIDVGAYSIQNGGAVNFGLGQPRLRFTMSMPSNNVRAEDRQVLLSIRTDNDSQTELGRISLTLQDDDMRRFEASLPPNTVGFLENELYVMESDPAVQIDIVRFRPDNSVLEIPYILMDGTATEGEDYFSPGLPVIYFGPGQREARILIPLGQDGRREPGENFILELDTFEVPEETNISTRIAVMIRDDDS
jgi:serine/threonine protein kinase